MEGFLNLSCTSQGASIKYVQIGGRGSKYPKFPRTYCVDAPKVDFFVVLCSTFSSSCFLLTATALLLDV